MELEMSISTPRNLKELMEARNKVTKVVKKRALGLLEAMGVSQDFVNSVWSFYNYRYNYT